MMEKYIGALKLLKFRSFLFSGMLFWAVGNKLKSQEAYFRGFRKKLTFMMITNGVLSFWLGQGGGGEGGFENNWCLGFFVTLFSR